jgi:glutathione-specific gamma-glutamylcyclotransferase
LGLQRSAALIMNAEGIAGLNRDYLINTVQQLENRGYEEPELRRLMEHIGALTGIIDQGSGI